MLSTPLGERHVVKFVPDLLPRMDAEVAALGRSMSARTEELEEAVIRRLPIALAALLLLVGCSHRHIEGRADVRRRPRRRRRRPRVTPEQARAIAKEAYIYGFPMVDNYRVQYSYFVDKQDPEYKGGWNEIHNTARVYTPEDTAIQTPNSDTPYSAVGADLRAEPLVLTVPPIEQDRYYSLQFVDGYTYNFAYVGSRTTGNGGGKYLLAGPDWTGREARGRRRGDPVGHRPGVRAVPHPAVRARPTSTRSRRSRRAIRSRRCRCSSTSRRRSPRRPSTSCRR